MLDNILLDLALNGIGKVNVFQWVLVLILETKRPLVRASPESLHLRCVL